MTNTLLSSHRVTSQYLLTELLGNIALSSASITLESLGLTPDLLRTLLGWAKHHEVSLRFALDPSCEYSRQENKEVSGDKVVEEERSGLFGQHSKTTTKRVVHQVSQHVWALRARFSLQACSGGQHSDTSVDLLREAAQQELVTSSDSVTTSPAGPLEHRYRHSVLCSSVLALLSQCPAVSLCVCVVMRSFLVFVLPPPLSLP